MQATLAEQIELVWALDEIANYQGQVSYKVVGEDTVKRVDCYGLRLEYIAGQLVRLKTRQLDLCIIHQPSTIPANDAHNIAHFPSGRTYLQYLRGDDMILKMLFRELQYLSPRHKTA